jgi:glycosyltransferase involved in cell wall biosynthesis
MKKVLFIDYFFPPLAADWRGTAFCKLLPDLGWQPIVVSADESVSYDKDYDLLKEIPSQLEVHRVRHREPPGVWNYFRHKLRIAADFPDYYKTWYSPAYREAKSILRQDDVHLIYSASPTFTTAFVAMKLKKELGIPWVADFLDGWAVSDFLNFELEQGVREPLRSLFRLRVKRAERNILESVDKMLVTSWHTKQRMCELHGVGEKKIEVITEGYDESVFKGLKPRALYPDRLTVTFLGSYYAHFGELVLRFLKVVNRVDRDAEVVFVGRAAARVHDMNMANATCILHVPRVKALEFGLGSNFLFVIMPSFGKWIAMKTFDYLRLGKPILALVPEDGDVAKIVREAKAGFILSYDEETLKQQLRDIFDSWRRGELKGFQPDWEYIKQYERKNLTQRLVGIFNEASR